MFSLPLTSFLPPVQYDDEWSDIPPAHHRSTTYTAARSVSPSIYSRRFGDSPRSSFDDLSISRTRPSSDTTQRNEDHYYGSEDETGEPVDESPEISLSAMGPTTRVYSRAPWEVGEGNILAEEDESQAETRSMRSGRSPFKKPKDQDSSSLAKGFGFPSSLTGVAKFRSSSVPRPSTDTQGFSSSTSSNYSRPSFSSNLRPESPFTSASTEYFQGANFQGAKRVDTYHHHDRPPGPFPRSLQNDRSLTDPDMRGVHPYANPDIFPQTQGYQPHTQHEQDDSEYILLSPTSSEPSGGSNRMASSTGPNPKQDHQPTHRATSPRHHPLPPSSALTPSASPHEGLPPKMAPWQHTRSSPTFQLLSLEEAQAMKAKQRSTAMGASHPTSSPPYIRGRTVSGNTAQERLKSYTLPLEVNDFEDGSKPASANLKSRRSLLGLFAKKEKDRPVTPRAASPPPPVPSLPPSIPGTPSGLVPQLSMSSAPPKSPRRIPPPSLSLVDDPPSTENNVKDSTKSSHSFLKNQHTTHSSAVVSSHPAVTTPQPRKKGSFLGHGSRAPLAKPPSINPNPGSTPSIAFPALQVRPVSTMMSSLPSDYLSGAASPPPVPTLPFRTTADSPSTPGFSSRSASISTGSSDARPQTPSVDHNANTIVLSQLRDQVNGAREVWKSQIADLEAQVRALKKEVEELKVAPCAACGHAPNGEAKLSVLNRPRAKTASGVRTLFGGDD